MKDVAHLSNQDHPQHADARVRELVELAIEMVLAGLPRDRALLEACWVIDGLLDFAQAWDAMSEAQARNEGKGEWTWK